MVIKTLRAREIIDSRATPTVEVYIQTDTVSASASVPSGKSTGSYEAHELRDGGSRFGGNGVRQVVQNIENEIASAVVGNLFDQRSLDEALKALDGTKDKSRLGANALLGVSLVFARASAIEKNMPLFKYISELSGESPKMPQPCFNIINGGAHADSGLSLQEFMLVPQGESIAQKIEFAAAVITELRVLLEEKGLSTSVGDEGGFAPHLPKVTAAFDVLVDAIGKAGLEGKVQLAIDAAANYFFVDGKYAPERDLKLSADELLIWYEQLTHAYPIVSIEDPFAEDAWDAFTTMTKKIGSTVKIVGDDLLTTNPERIAQAVEKNAVTTVLLKPNQIGTLSETLEAAHLARKGGLQLFASHRSGETNDTFIADLAVGLGCEYVKAGSLVRGERVAKYNRLMEIGDTMHG